MTKRSFLDKQSDKIGIGRVLRHLFICTGPKCYDSDHGNELWKYIKIQCKTLNITDHLAMRSRSSCLRICGQGPIMVIYPEGTWYAELTKEKIDRILKEHIVSGTPCSDLAFTQAKLLPENSYRYAEDRAAAYFTGSGYEVLARNFRRQGTEIDLIASKGDHLIAVEVKYRSTEWTKKQDVDIEQLMPNKKIAAIEHGLSVFLGEYQDSGNLEYSSQQIDLVVMTGQGEFWHFPLVH